MAIARLWWADDSDIALTEGRLSTLKNGQLSKWLWLKWEDPEDKEKAFSSLYREITSCSMFEEGKVVIIKGLPSCHSQLAECLQDIPEGVVLVIIGGMAKNLKLYKAAKKMADQNLAKIDESFDLTKSNAKTWIKERATYYGGTIDDFASKILFDLVGPKPNLLDREIQKMLMMTENKHITAFVAQDACAFEGDTDVFRFCTAIMQNNRTIAHELLHRLLIKNENPHKICGYLMDWARKLAIAESYGRNHGMIDKAKLESLYKIDRDENDLKSISIEQFNESNSLAKQRLIANTGALYYTCKELNESSKSKEWGINVIPKVMRLMINLRTGKEPERCFHVFVEECISDTEERNDDGTGTDNN